MRLLGSEDRDIPGMRSLARQVQTLGARKCLVHSIEFEPGDFDADALARSGIELPVDIARSVPKRQAEFLFGRLAATMALRSAGAARARIERGLLRQPIFPRGFVGSITHTSRLAAAAVLPADSCEGLGIDIEDLLSEQSLPDVERVALCPKELDVLRACSAMPHETLVTLVFSAKESFYKAVAANVGRIFEYDALRWKRLDPGQATISFVTTGNLSSAWPAGREVEVHYSLRADRAVSTAFAW
jgi:4'-phosphopantetheinyl transferase EntD